MIGNLISALGVAVLSASIVIAGDVQARNVRAFGTIPVSENDTSLDVGDSYKVYIPNLTFSPTMTYELDDLPSNQYNGYIYTINSEGSTQYNYTGYPKQFEDLVCQTNATGQYLNNCGYRMNLALEYGISTYYLDFDFLAVNKYIYWNNTDYYIDAIEFTPTIICYDSNQNVVSRDVSLLSLIYNDSVMPNTGGYFALVAQNFLGVGVNPEYFNVGHLRLRFDTTELTNLGVASFTLGFSGYWCCNYRANSSFGSGYSVGYSEGAKDGYAKGYADAMALVNGNGTFNDLFNSVADTPLRFLYGLFSFDLFGTSVLVIILTLLTGIAVFGIIKKAWK